jgi:hypothetical protein
LERDGLFGSEVNGRQKYFQLNRGYPLFNEVRKIVAKTIGAAPLIAQSLKKIDGIDEAYLYGSFASNQQDPQNLLKEKKIVVAAACNRPNCLVLPFSCDRGIHGYLAPDSRRGVSLECSSAACSEGLRKLTPDKSPSSGSSAALERTSSSRFLYRTAFTT